ncbi:EF-hand domain-containing protein 1-like [Chelonus insularis]|uniref:EF-hand domain-containing protein 1-like n=1 Tax=Chelonus insularis TaxID=460826 RepID=UPI001588C49D|nr:EF-hand domain-containing protein 1-like [Chelonus insularis]
MEEFPHLPGYSFPTYSDQNYKLKQKLNYSNGCRVICDSSVGIGRRPVDAASSAYTQEPLQEVIFDPSLIYGRNKDYPYRQVIPHYVLYAQKCLNFKAFFRQNILNSPSEQYRIRHVNIIYFLEDDTMSVMEPPVDNAGFKQGKLVKRSKIPQTNGKYYHWKDLNVGLDITIYGVVYHTVDCDQFTKEFLTSQGIDVGDKEDPPIDSYTQERLMKLDATRAASSLTKRAHSAPSKTLKRFLQYDGMILTFEATWNDDFYQILYFLTDDTIAVKEIQGSNSGKDPVRLLLKKTKVPKKWTDMPQTFPSIYLERGDEEVDEYYSPLDLKVGETILIFNRRFFLYDCDNFTRNYYKDILNINQPLRISLELTQTQKICNETLTSKSLKHKERSKKEDVIRKLYNHPKKLRYLASMVAVHPEDKDRDFILEYNLADGKIKILEIGKRNSGHRAGCFLASMYVPKPSSFQKQDDTDDIIYYGPEDFYIGAKINIFNHQFIIKGADLFVLRYIEANPDNFTSQLLDNMRSYFSVNEKMEKNEDKTIDDNKNNYNEPIYPVDTTSNSQKIISHHLLEEEKKDIADNYKYIDNRKEENRQITWQDEVEVPIICNN